MTLRLTLLGLFLVTCHATAQIHVQYAVKALVLEQSDKGDAAAQALRASLLNPYLAIMDRSTGELTACEGKSYFSIKHNERDEVTNPVASVMLKTSRWLTTARSCGNISSDNSRLVISDYNKESWQISDKPSIIAGYSCYKATKMLKYKQDLQKEQLLEVWFTPDVPVDSGLMDATGLPGLILYYKNGMFEFTAHKVETLKECDLKIKELTQVSYTEHNLQYREKLANKKKQ